MSVGVVGIAVASASAVQLVLAGVVGLGFGDPGDPGSRLLAEQTATEKKAAELGLPDTESRRKTVIPLIATVCALATDAVAVLVGLLSTATAIVVVGIICIIEDKRVLGIASVILLVLSLGAAFLLERKLAEANISSNPDYGTPTGRRLRRFVARFKRSNLLTRYKAVLFGANLGSIVVSAFLAS